MSYMLLIIEPTTQRATRTEAEGRELYGRMQQFGERLQAQGKLKASESLASQSSAVRVSTAGGSAKVTDGPFAEAKEMVGGFFIVKADSLEAALEIAKDCPDLPLGGSVEVRDVVVFE